MNDDERDDIVEKWTEVAIVAKAFLKYEAASNKVDVFLTQLRRLPNYLDALE